MNRSSQNSLPVASIVVVENSDALDLPRLSSTREQVATDATSELGCDTPNGNQRNATPADCADQNEYRDVEGSHEEPLTDANGKRKRSKKEKLRGLKGQFVLLKVLRYLQLAWPYLLRAALIALTVRSIVCRDGFDDDNTALLVLCCCLLVGPLRSLAKRCDFLRVVVGLLRDKVADFLRKYDYYVKIVLLVCSSSVIVILVILSGAEQPRNLIALAGVASLLLVSVALSKHRTKIKWRIVVTGLYLQFFFAATLLRFDKGQQALKYIGVATSRFLNHSYAGAYEVFGPKNMNDHYFIFVLMPSVVFFGAVTNVLYYSGIAQRAIRAIAAVIQLVMGTSPAESIAAATNIFIGNSETLMAIKPVLNDVTKSEINSILTAGFATVSGSVFAAYASLGVSPTHLIVASVMSAPAALAIAKIFVPETRPLIVTRRSMKTMSLGEFQNVIHALACGAVSSVSVCANITVSVITFTAMTTFFNSTLQFISNQLCRDPETPLTFELICSYLFWPLAYIMGIRTVDCFKVAQLIGVKIFLNEFLAYKQLGQLIENQQIVSQFINATLTNSTQAGIFTSDAFNNTFYCSKTALHLITTNATIVGGFISKRSADIATYALCGFSNICCLGIYVGAFGALAPKRQATVSKLVTRSLVAGNIACYLTATIASLLYKDSDTNGWSDPCGLTP